MGTLTIFLYGMVCTAFAVTAMLFLRLARKTRDRLFTFFAAAFGVLAIERVLLAAVDPTNELAPYVYLARLLAFGLIIAAIIDKNRHA